MDINFNSKIKFPSSVIIQQIADGELIMLNTSTESYFGLDETGTMFFNSLIKSKNVNEALENIYNTFEVEKDTLAGDLLVFINDLKKNNLIEIESS